MNYSFSREDEEALDGLFRRYRDSFPETEPGAHFMPNLWSRIESRHTFSFVFGRLSRTFATVSAALCLLLAALNFMSTPQMASSYTDALLADSSAEQTYFTESIRTTPVAENLAPR